MSMATAARLRLLSVRPDSARCEVEAADRRTSLADARTALCLALGVPLGDIHPASGHDLSFAAYESVRETWRRITTEAGWTWHLIGACRQAGAYWQATRPQYPAVLPWPDPGPLCDTCGASETDWPADHELHRPGSGQCAWCRQTDIEEDVHMALREG